MLNNELKEQNRKKFTAFTDGSADNLNPQRPGGSAFIIFNEDGTELKRASKGFMGTSNNRMELLAIISVVNLLPYGSEVTVYTDSQYCIKALQGSAYANLDQINLYHRICIGKKLIVHFNWIKGHDGNKYNELCDQMARNEYSKMVEEHNSKRPASKKKVSLKQENKKQISNYVEETYYSSITTKNRRKPTKRGRK